jgi:multidrug resistance efflux pump
VGGRASQRLQQLSAQVSNCVRVASRVPVTITVSTAAASRASTDVGPTTRLNESGNNEVWGMKRAMMEISPWTDLLRWA